MYTCIYIYTHFLPTSGSDQSNELRKLRAAKDQSVANVGTPSDGSASHARLLSEPCDFRLLAKSRSCGSLDQLDILGWPIAWNQSRDLNIHMCVACMFFEHSEAPRIACNNLDTSYHAQTTWHDPPPAFLRPPIFAERKRPRTTRPWWMPRSHRHSYCLD